MRAPRAPRLSRPPASRLDEPDSAACAVRHLAPDPRSGPAVLFAILGLHAVLAAVAPLVAKRFGRGVFLACALGPAAAVAWALAHAAEVLEGGSVGASFAWAPSLGMTVTLRFDAFALLMVALVSGIGLLIFLYAYGYFSKPRPDLGRFAGALIGFSGAMLGLVLSDNLLVVFLFWELTSITSYLLIGFEDRKPEARDAALQALLTTGSGGLALLGGIVLVGQVAGTYELSALAANPPEASPLLVVGLLLMLAGAFTKSAQVPFHTWLPGAMAAPTPVSAYLHSATMVKAGVYLVARLSPIFAGVGPYRQVVVVFGIATMLLGAYRALRQHDLKLVLAFGTISQLGFLIVLFGVGTPETTFAGTAMILAHGVFKASLFMVVGVVDKKAGTRDVRRLTGVARAMPLVAWSGALAAASMAGLPPLLGFIAKEAALESFLHGEVGSIGLVALVGIVLGSMLTFAYSARFVAGVFGRLVEREHLPQGPVAIAKPAPVFAGPAALLAVLGLAFGIAPLLVDELVNQAAVALDPAWKIYHLKLWHGFNLALGLSGLVVLVGSLLYIGRGAVARLQDAVPPLPDSKRAYQGIVAGLLSGAKRLTGVVQNGSLPTYQMVILATLLALPGVALVRKGIPDLGVPFATDAGQVAVGLVITVAALSAVRTGHRFVAILLLGAVGYGVAILFVLQGAPDLALTQLLIETLSLVIFALVLRRLPLRFTRRPAWGSRALRAAIAGGVGAMMAGFALFAGAARTADPVGYEHLARSYSEAGGANVVNVILVDFRGFDTMGEIVVLLVAALGIITLIQAARADRAAAAQPTGDEAATSDGAGAPAEPQPEDAGEASGVPDPTGGRRGGAR
jgi:multicomponent Na+:H+ antiporter subunit A